VVVDSLRYLLTEDNPYVLGMLVWLVSLAVGFSAILNYRRFAHDSPRRVQRANVALSVWTALATLTGVELCFALFHDTTDSFNRTKVSRKWYRIHADRQHRLLVIGPREGLYVRDDHDFVKDPGDGRFHICFFGDSFTFGHGINVGRRSAETT